MKNSVLVCISELGKCEHCSSHFVIGEKYDEIVVGRARCTPCGSRLTRVSCGLVETEPGHWVRARWVNHLGVWSEEEPQHAFILGRFRTFPQTQMEAVAS